MTESPDVIQTTILDSITEGVFTVDSSFRITSFNSAAEKITGTPREQAVGKPCREILRASICEGRCALHQTMRTGKPIVGKNVVIVDPGGTPPVHQHYHGDPSRTRRRDRGGSGDVPRPYDD